MAARTHTTLVKSQTDPFSDVYIRPRKRLIICCDGTWQDGVLTENRTKFTNILRIARTIEHEDKRVHPPIAQIVFYQSGIGSERTFYAEYIEGTTGETLAGKVEEAYAFLAHNYHPGDEIFLFGFSRGAYTARMVAMFIGAIGILNRTDMDHFGRIFVAYQKLGKSSDKEEIKKLKEELAPFQNPNSPGIIRASSNGQAPFSVKCVGVFDTVDAVGLPEEVNFLPNRNEIHTLFGFPDRKLGEHIEQAYQALALNETREDFDCAKFELTELGRQKKQILHQCWFTGCHSDIGGGYAKHDLADLALTWMIANVEDILAIDVDYLKSLPNPAYAWGSQPPHNPTTGIYALAHTITRPLPVPDDPVTHESIHSSVLEQAELSPMLRERLQKSPSIVAELKPLEAEMKVAWKAPPESSKAGDAPKSGEAGSRSDLVEKLVHDVFDAVIGKS